MHNDITTAPTVLIADDERLNRDLLRTFLENAGYRVVEAVSGEQAIDMAREHHPALVMLDIRMSGLDGFEVTSRLREEPATRDIRIALISAQNRASDQARAREVGADAYIYKLTEWSAIMSQVADLIDNR